MIPRHIADKIIRYAKEYPIISIVGPRQSGKTTLAKALFPNHTYLSLENLDLRNRAANDPRGFLNDFGTNLILDEVQRVPELFSYLQGIVDMNRNPAQYILTGSSQFLLMEQVTQSLAGRVITFKLYPLTFTELFRYQADPSFEDLFRKTYETRKPIDQQQLYELMWQGFYPRIYDRNLDSYKWLENYLLTYAERDIRSLLNVRNLRTFEHFLILCASQSGQLMNYASLSNTLGISLATVKEWISILEISGLIFILQPYYKNFSKRIVKTPKIYFVDTGILCHLLSIRSVEQLKTHPLLGMIFETFIVSEAYKRFYNLACIPPLYFWRDQTGNEIDLLIDEGQLSFPIEIKLSQSYNTNLKKNIKYWMNLTNNLSKEGMVIYCGDTIHEKAEPIPCVPWYFL